MALIDDTVTTTLQEFGKELETELKQLLGNAGLPSIVPKTSVQPGPLGPRFSLELPGYLVFVEYGVKGVESTPHGAEDSPFQYKHLGVSREMITAITKWTKNKGIVPREKPSALKNLRKKNLKNAVGDKTTALSFAIATNIKKHGLSPRHILRQALTDERLQALANTLGERIAEVVAVWLVKK